MVINKTRKKIPLFAFTEDTVDLIPPFGLMLLADQLRKKGFQPSIHHYRKNDIDGERIVALSEDALFVGFSSLTGGMLRSALELSRQIKDAHGASMPVVWGGVHATMSPATCLREQSIDYVIQGEGELAIGKLADYIRNQRTETAASIPGLAYKDNGVLKLNPREIIKDIEPFEYAWDLIDVEKYIRPQFGYQRTLNYISSRGCPFNCTFCYNLFFNGRRWRGWSAKKVIEDIRQLKKKHDIEAVYFHDDYFFGNRRRADEILQGIDMPWYAELRATDFTSDRVQRLQAMKAIGFFFGAESGSAKVLRSLNKEITSGDILNVARVCRAADVRHLRCSFIMFTPDETLADIRATVLLIVRFKRAHPLAAIGIGNYTPYPGVDLTKRLEEKGWHAPETLEGWAEYDRQLAPNRLGIFSDRHIRRVLRLKQVALTSVEFYKILARRGRLGTLIARLLAPVLTASDRLFSLGLLPYPVEFYLLRLIFLVRPARGGMRH